MVATAVADHSDILEDDDAVAPPAAEGAPDVGSQDEGASHSAGAANAASEAAASLAGLQGLVAAGAASAEGEDPNAEVRAQLGSIASTSITAVAEQLSSITEEMNKIRQELYGDQGIGGIAKELEKLKSGELGGLLDSLNLGGDEEPARPRQAPASRAAASSGSASSANNDARQRRPAGGDTRSVEQDAERMENMRRKLLARSRAEKEKPSVSFAEKLMLLFLVLVCLYVASPFFRNAVQQAFNSMAGIENEDEGEQEFFD